MIIVGRHVEGITLNPLEYLLDDTGEVKVFEDKEQVVEYLRQQGATDDDLYWLVFEEVE